jgi:calcium-dependent protein kinase
MSARSFVMQKTNSVWDKYDRLDELGRGAYGVVYRVQTKVAPQLRAVKLIYKAQLKPDDFSQFSAEIELLRTMDHPNILRLYEFYEDSKCFYLVTEYLPGGELFEFIIKQRALTEGTAALVMSQLLSAVNYCHQNNIVHRDLKPENLLLAVPGSCSQLKVIDFGTSTLRLPGQNLNKLKGTAYYIAPEVIGGSYNEKCDLWSCGVILYMMLSGRPPFNGCDTKSILAKVKKAKYKMDSRSWDLVSDLAKDFIRKLMNPDPQSRLSAEEAFLHPWIVAYSSSSPPKSEVIASSLDNLRSFRATHKLKQAACVFIASQMIGEQEQLNLTVAFKALDTNNDGRLSKGELLQGFKELYTEEEAEQKVTELINHVDFDGSGFVEYSEFLSAGMKLDAEENKQRLEAAFAEFDTDKSGGISLAELKEILGACTEDDLDLEQLLEEVDLDHNGEVNAN